MAEQEAELGVDIKANPEKGLSFILWNSIAIIMDTRNPIGVRHSAETYLEKCLSPYWDKSYEEAMRAVHKRATTWRAKPGLDKDEFLLGLRFEATRGLMFRKQFDGVRDVVYDDDL